MFFGKLKKENEFLKREIAALLSTRLPCEICVFRGTLAKKCIDNCEHLTCSLCESEMKKTCACCSCVNHGTFENFLWNGRDT